MKLIIAIIRPENLEVVQAALHERKACLISVSQVLGDGREPGRTGIYRGTEFRVRRPKLRLEIAADDRGVEAAVEAIRPEVAGDRVVLGYRGLDGFVRRTILQFSPRPSLLTASTARLDLSLRPQQEATFDLTVGCERQPATSLLLAFGETRTAAESDLERYNAWSCHLHTSNGQINAWSSALVGRLRVPPVSGLPRPGHQWP